MVIKIIANGLIFGPNAYFNNGWNRMDAFLVLISIIDIGVVYRDNLMSSSILSILKVFRLLRVLRPLQG